MRLTQYEITIIKNLSQKIFNASTVRLFRSRVDDSKKGGDIDLFIECDSSKDTIQNILQFSAQLQDEIGEQKLDVVVKSRLDDNRLIV